MIVMGLSKFLFSLNFYLCGDDFLVLAVVRPIPLIFLMFPILINCKMCSGVWSCVGSGVDDGIDTFAASGIVL